MARLVVGLVFLVAVCPWFPGTNVAHAATSAAELGGLELTAPVRHHLWRVQESWQSWTKAFLASDRATADAELEQLRTLAQHLGMSRLPDLSAAAAAYAIQMAQDGDAERATWALETSEALDPGRPETAFAQSVVRRTGGDYAGAVSSILRGYILLLGMPLERSLWLNNLLLWVVYSLVLAGAVFVVLLMASRGRSLFYDLSRLYSPPLGSMAADLTTVLVLLWPLVLPSGVVWLGLYWSVLLWAYGSKSERGVLIVLWLLLGIAPSLMTYQQRSAQVALVPASRLVENLASERLYGALFSDLEVLRAVVPDSDIVTEIIADLHRRLGQWDHARAIYTELSQDPDRNSRYAATAYSNIGVYFHRQGEYQNAVNYFRRAAEADPNLAEAYFNLSQAYAQLYDFDQQHAAMAKAKVLAADEVDVWNVAGVTAEDSAVPVDGGLRRVGELRQNLAELWQMRSRSLDMMEIWRRYRALTVAFAAIALALILYVLRKQMGLARSDRLAPREGPIANSRWFDALVPGWASVRKGRGIAAFFGILVPSAILMVSLLRGLGYRMPLATDPGQWLALTFTIGALAVVYLIRAGLAMSS